MSIPLSVQRLVNVVENGGLNGAQVETVLANLSLRQQLFDSFDKRGIIERLVYSTASMDALLKSATARANIFANPNMMDSLCKSTAAMDVIVNDATVFGALCDSSVARQAMISNKVSRSIFFTSQHLFTQFWNNSTRVDNVTSLFSRMSVTTAASGSFRRLLFNVDWTLIGPPFSIWGRTADTAAAYDQKTGWISPNTTIYNNATVPANFRFFNNTDQTAWQFYEVTNDSDLAFLIRNSATSSGYYALEQETNAAVPVVTQVTETISGTARRAFALGASGVPNSATRYWGMQFTRIA